MFKLILTISKWLRISWIVLEVLYSKPQSQEDPKLIKKSICVGMIYLNRSSISRTIEYSENFLYTVSTTYFEDICICAIYKAAVNKNKYLIIFTFLKLK